MSTWNRSAASHLYRRAAFGAPLETLLWAEQAGRDETLASIFSLREPDAFLEAGIESLLGLNKIEQLQSWWMAHILKDRTPLVERVALMWHDHFATSNDKVDDVRLMHTQLQLLREKGLGDFRVLMHALAIDPAMLVWLDGIRNEKGRPNENFGREVLELFGLGIGEYTEEDIGQAARALTGWRVVGRKAVFDQKRHELGEKRMFGRGGVQDAADVIDRVLEHPACARHITRRLLAEFVHPLPSAESIARWSPVLLEVEWNVERFLRRLLASDDFYAPTARRSRIAGPVEMAAISVLTLSASIAPRLASQAASQMGQTLFRPPSVKGWDGGQNWIHAGNWLARHKVLVTLAFDHTVDLQTACGHPQNKAAVPNACLELLLPGESCPQLRQGLVDAAESASSVEEALRECIAITLTSPHHHLA